MDAPAGLPLTSARLRLRALQPDDVDALCAYRKLPEVARYQSWESFEAADARRLINDTCTQEPGVPGTWAQWGIIESASGKLIGDCGLHTMPEDKRLLELGITMAPEAQGKGYATEALQTVMAFGFNTLGAHRISALTDADNLAARALFGRLGFRQEAHFIAHLWFKGAWGSECVFALLRREWEESRK